MHKGSCLCGAVRFEVEGNLGRSGACHCRQCRKQSGHYRASTEVALTSLKVTGSENVRWYQSSELASRGFCSVCGSFLFWKSPDADAIEIALGAFDTPTQTQLTHHIFVADKGDYYDISDNLPQSPQKDDFDL